MAHCAMSGCKNEVVGGFQQIVAAATNDDPHGTVPGLKRAWCREHEAALRAGCFGKKGRWLTRQELSRG
jgi:hypothetical protein